MIIPIIKFTSFIVKKPKVSKKGRTLKPKKDKDYVYEKKKKKEVQISKKGRKIKAKKFKDFVYIK